MSRSESSPRGPSTRMCRSTTAELVKVQRIRVLTSNTCGHCFASRRILWSMECSGSGHGADGDDGCSATATHGSLARVGTHLLSANKYEYSYEVRLGSWPAKATAVLAFSCCLDAGVMWPRRMPWGNLDRGGGAKQQPRMIVQSHQPWSCHPSECAARCQTVQAAHQGSSRAGMEGRCLL